MSTRTHLFSSLVLVVALLLSALVAAPAPSATAGAAAITMPAKILLKGGAAQVERTWTATPVDAGGNPYSWPSGVTPRYQWYRSVALKQDPRPAVPIGADPADHGFVAIPGAVGRSYPLVDADHGHNIVVRVVVGSQAINSSTSNWVLWDMAPPVLVGTGFVGSTITIPIARWESDWNFVYIWRRDGKQIPGTTGKTRSYRLSRADGGHGLSVLAYGVRTFSDGVQLIDRYATRKRILFRTSTVAGGSSPARRQLVLTTRMAATGQVRSALDLPVRVYDGRRLIRRVSLVNGARTVRIRGLATGRHLIRVVFPGRYGWYTASRDSFYVRVR